MPERPVPPHDHTRFSRGGRLTAGAISNFGSSSTPPVSGGGGGGGSSDHGALSGLGDDDHTSYVTVIGGGGETLNTVASTGSSEAIDLSLGNVHDFTLTVGTVSLSLTGTAAGVSDSTTVILRQDGTGNRIVVWPGAVIWPSGTTPTLGTAASTVDVFTLFTLDDGTTWYGFHANGAGGTVSYATPSIALGTAAAAGTATTLISSDSTIVAFDATVPVTQAMSDTAATGSAAVAARRDHRHGMPASSSGIGEILISDTPSTPLIFADLLQNEAQDDLLYADP